MVHTCTKGHISLVVCVCTKIVAYPLRRGWFLLCLSCDQNRASRTLGRFVTLTVYRKTYQHFCIFVSTLDTVTMTSALLIGHSFIRHTRAILIVLPPGRKCWDISKSRQQVASIAWDKAELAKMIFRFFTSSQNIDLVSDLWKAESTVVAISPQIVLLHIGSNDLAHFIQDDKSAIITISTSLVDFAKWLLDYFEVRFMIINSMVPRDSHNMCCSADTFLTNTTHFSRKLGVWVRLCKDFPTIT